MSVGENIPVKAGSTTETTCMPHGVVVGALAFMLMGSVTAAKAEDVVFRLRSKFTGDTKCLDIANDGRNNQPTMAACGDAPGQMWTISLIGSTGQARLRTELTGDAKCLDIVNDGQNNQLIMATCGNFPGQRWLIAPTIVPGSSRLRTVFTGDGKCLDVIKEGKGTALIMTPCGNASGQMWSIARKQ